MMRGAGKAYRAHVPHLSTLRSGPWASRRERSLFKQRGEQRYRRSLIYKGLPVLWMSGASARYSCLHAPVETVTPPRRQKKAIPFRFPGLRKRRESSISAISLFLSKSNPLRWASILLRTIAREEACSFRLPLNNNATLPGFGFAFNIRMYGRGKPLPYLQISTSPARGTPRRRSPR